ncbi:MAG: AraC family transcriptional regulator [Kiritimatiellia bacterium]|nr:AraC family transcriptional regulator [Kiritimatiellia bacterium]
MPQQQPKHFNGSPYFAMNGLPIYAVHVTDHPPYSFHDHDFLEIVLVLNGKAKHKFSEYEYEISKGDILIIPVHHYHAYLSTDKLEIINLLFDPREAAKILFDLPGFDGYQRLFSKNTLFSSQSKHKGCFKIAPANFAVVVNLLANFISEINGRRHGCKAMAVSFFIQAICVIARCHEHVNAPASSLLLASIEQTIDFMETHYQENITLDQLARLAHMSRSSYQRSFGKLMNTSPINHLVQFRIRKASALLRFRPELNITAIALQTGFTDSNYFARVFRKIIRHTPREFRGLS